MPQTTGLRSLLARFWSRWKRFGHVVGDFQARVILTLIYFLILAPYGLMVRLVSDPLNIKPARRVSTWLAKSEGPPTLEAARKQF